MVTDGGHDPTNYEGFTRFHLELLDRFRDVAIDNHLQNGNLDGSGDNPDVQAHVKGVVDAETLLRQYEFPVVMSIPRTTSNESGSTAADDTTLSFSVSAWLKDYDQVYGIEEALIIVGNVVNNIENNRSLESSPGAGDPLASETTFEGTNFDFELNVQPQTHMKYATANFTVKTRRKRR